MSDDRRPKEIKTIARVDYVVIVRTHRYVRVRSIHSDPVEAKKVVRKLEKQLKNKLRGTNYDVWSQRVETLA